MHRTISTLAVSAAMTAALLAGCAPSPATTPTPTPTGFANETEAFAAAEATYRAYVDALNEVDLADPATFEPVSQWLEGTALADSKSSFDAMHSESLTVSGRSVLSNMRVKAFGPERVVVHVCLDVSNVELTDEHGQSAVSSERVDKQPLEVELVRATSTSSMKIASSMPTVSTVCE